MQILTQLDPQSVKNIIFDVTGSADDANEFQLDMNLRNISMTNFEQIRERLRQFTERVTRRIEQNSVDLQDQGISMFIENNLQMQVTETSPELEMRLEQQNQILLDQIKQEDAQI